MYDLFTPSESAEKFLVVRLALLHYRNSLIMIVLSNHLNA